MIVVFSLFQFAVPDVILEFSMVFPMETRVFAKLEALAYSERTCEEGLMKAGDQPC